MRVATVPHNSLHVLTLLASVALCSMGCSPPSPESLEPAVEERRRPETEVAEHPLFQEVTEEVGLDFRHQTETPGTYFFPEIMGSGCALLDFDRDGDLDIYLVNLGRPYERNDEEAKAQRSPNCLFEQTADGVFVDVTAGSGLGDRELGMGVAVGDVNNDGYADLYTTNVGADHLYVNQRDGTFRDVTEVAGVDNMRWGCSACFFDYDRDGLLDLFVTNYVDYVPIECTRIGGGDLDYCGPQVFRGTSDVLYHNETPAASGETNQVSPVRFRNVSVPAGIAGHRAAGLGVLAVDLNEDRWLDVYVANDRTANFLWINQRDGSFREEAILSGAAYDAQGLGQASMGVTIGDVNQDQKLDLFVTHLENQRSTLYVGRQDIGFDDGSVKSGLGQMSLPFTSFGTALVDLDHDGDLDLPFVSGRVVRAVGDRRPNDCIGPGSPCNAQEFWLLYGQPNQILLNDGKGRFAERECVGDPFSSPSEVSRGLAVGDIDRDGDMDCLVTNTGGRARLYYNQTKAGGHWLIVRAVLPQFGGRDAYGALVAVVCRDQRLVRQINPGYGYLTSNDPRAHFGLGPVKYVERIEVQWPDGTEETFEGGPVDRERLLRQGQGSEARSP